MQSQVSEPEVELARAERSKPAEHRKDAQVAKRAACPLVEQQHWERRQRVSLEHQEPQDSAAPDARLAVVQPVRALA